MQKIKATLLQPNDIIMSDKDDDQQIIISIEPHPKSVTSINLTTQKLKYFDNDATFKKISWVHIYDEIYFIGTFTPPKNRFEVQITSDFINEYEGMQALGYYIAKYGPGGVISEYKIFNQEYDLVKKTNMKFFKALSRTFYPDKKVTKSVILEEI